jgi:DNA-binding MarR family transcriptional regulator
MAVNGSEEYLRLPIFSHDNFLLMPSSIATSTAAEEAWGLFWRIFSADKPRRLAVMTELGLSFQQSMALMRLEPDAPLPMSALAQALQCDNSNVTGIVDRLEERGLVRRDTSPGDRRVKLLVLTDEGEKVRAEITKRLAEPPEPIADLAAADQRALRDIMRRIVGSERESAD